MSASGYLIIFVREVDICNILRAREFEIFESECFGAVLGWNIDTLIYESG